MDNITNITAAPLTRRQAREMERRTGVRPVATSSQAFRHDTGEIERNEMTALVSVLPTELVAKIAEPAAEYVAQEVPAAFDGRSLTVRASIPASLVTQRRRRTAGTFAAAAAVASVASAGLASAGTVGVSAADHQANLLSATAPAEATDEVIVDAAATETAAVPAAAVEVTERDTTVQAISASSVLSSAQTVAPAVAASSTSSSSDEGTSGSSDEGTSGSSESSSNSGGGASSFVPSGALGADILAAAKAQIGISGLDCTDMVQDALAAVGLVTSRFDGGPDLGVSSFFAFGTEISWADAQPGDIIIAPGEHVAIYAGDGMAVHGGWNGAADDTVLAGLGPYSYYVVRVG